MAFLGLTGADSARVRLAAFATLLFTVSIGVGPAQAREFATHEVSFGEGPLYSVQELAVARDGQSIVLSDDGQVRRYSLDGELLDRLYWSPRVPFPGDPLVSVVCGKSGELYIGNYFWGTIQRLDQDGG